MDQSPCFQCNLYVANRFRKFQDGAYKEQFCLECNPENQIFIKHPMQQNSRCDFSDIVCYSSKYGAGKCLKSNTDTLTFDIQGNLVRRPYLYY